MGRARRTSNGTGGRTPWSSRDTWSIAAEQYAGDPREGVWKLQKQNGLAGVTIRPGQRLLLP